MECMGNEKSMVQLGVSALNTLMHAMAHSNMLKKFEVLLVGFASR
jgi:hypothetical protein